MPEWQDQLNTILSDPDAMAQIASLAQSLSGQGGDGSGQQSAASANGAQSSGGSNPQDAASALSGLGGLDPELLTRLAPLLRRLNRPESSQTTAFLLALKPFLSEKRRGKVEKAAQLARLIHLGKAFLTQGQGEERV